MPLPQPKEQRAERKDASEGLGTAPVCAEKTWGHRDEYLRRVQCPPPMEGAQPGQQPLPKPERQTWGPRRRLQEKSTLYNLYDESGRSSQLIHWSVS